MLKRLPVAILIAEHFKKIKAVAINRAAHASLFFATLKAARPSQMFFQHRISALCGDRSKIGIHILAKRPFSHIVTLPHWPCAGNENQLTTSIQHHSFAPISSTISGRCCRTSKLNRNFKVSDRTIERFCKIVHCLDRCFIHKYIELFIFLRVNAPQGRPLVLPDGTRRARTRRLILEARTRLKLNVGCLHIQGFCPSRSARP